MNRNNTLYVHSPPTIELAPPPKKHRKPTPSGSLPVISPPTTHPTCPVSIPVTSHATAPPVDIINSCPPLISSRRPSTSSPPALYSLPEFKVGSLPRQPPSAWPVAMVNDFLTPPSNRSFSLSDRSSDDSDDQPLIFNMDD